MSCKIDAIMKLLAAKGKVVVSFERGAGVDRLTITKYWGGRILVGTHPGARITSVSESEIRSTLEGIRMFIKGWK